MSDRSLEEMPLYFIATGDDGLWSSVCGESELKQAVHDVMCVCKQPWEQCGSDGVPKTCRLLDDADEWSGHDPFPRFSWGQQFEDGYIRVTLLTDSAFRSHLSPVQGEELPELDVTTEDLSTACHILALLPKSLSDHGGAQCLAEHIACRERQLRAYGAEIGRLKKDLETSEHWKKCFRTRMFSMKSSDNSSHTTACTIWGDDGQGNTLEKYAQPLPCNCGALANYERSRAEAAELARSASRADALKAVQACHNNSGNSSYHDGVRDAEQAILVRMEKAS